MDSNYLPLWKTLETPLFSLNQSHVELFSLMALFLVTLAAMASKPVFFFLLGLLMLIVGQAFGPGEALTTEQLVFTWLFSAGGGIFLVLSAVFFLRTRGQVEALTTAVRHRQFLRHVVQVVSVLIFFYIVYSCLGVFGMIRNTFHGLGLIGTVFTEAFFWISLPVVILSFSVTTGPYFCGWVCPTGTFQEATAAMREYLPRLPGWALLLLAGATAAFSGLVVLVNITGVFTANTAHVTFVAILLFFPSAAWLTWYLAKRYGKKRAVQQVARPTGLNLVLTGLFFAGFVGLVIWTGSTKQFYVEDSSLYWAASLILVVFLVISRAVDDGALRALRTVSFVIIVGSALLKSMIVSPVHFAFADVRDPASALTTLVLIMASLFVGRAWCRYVCPWGYLMGCVHRVSRLRVQATEVCTECGQCNQHCRVEAIHDGQVDVTQCQFCLACVDSCEHGGMEIIDAWKRRD